MEHVRGGREIWRLAVLTIGLVSLLALAIPAQAGLGDLLDQILDPVGDLPVVGDIVDPIVDDVVDPVAGGLLDPIADQVLAPVLNPIIDTVVTPIVDEVVTPVVNNVVPPVIEPVVETVPPVATITTTTPIRVAREEAIARATAEFEVSPSRSESDVLVATPTTDTVVSPARVTTERRSLEAALAVQAALVDRGTNSLVDQDAGLPGEVQLVDVGWLTGLTTWLRTSAGGIFALLALPIRLLELLARALLTAGSGLIAPLSMLLAFTAYLIKDRGWSRAQA